MNLTHDAQNCELPNDDISLFTDYNAKNFPDSITPKHTAFKITRLGYEPEIQILELTKREKKYYIKVFNRYAKKLKWHNFEKEAFAHQLSGYFTQPESMKKSLSLWTRFKYWFGSTLFKLRTSIEKDVKESNKSPFNLILKTDRELLLKKQSLSWFVGPKIIYFSKNLWKKALLNIKYKIYHKVVWEVLPEEITAMRYMLSGKLIPEINFMPPIKWR